MAKSNPEIWKRPLSSTPNSCSAGLAGVTRHHATPEPKLHKRATRRRKASAVFCGVGRSINLDLDQPDDHESGDGADEAGASAMRAFFQSSLQSAKPLMVSGSVQSVDQTQQLPPLPSGGSLAASLLSWIHVAIYKYICSILKSARVSVSGARNPH